MFSLCWLLTLLCHVSNWQEVFPLMFPPSMLDLYCCFPTYQVGQGLPRPAPPSSLRPPPWTGFRKFWIWAIPRDLCLEQQLLCKYVLHPPIFCKQRQASEVLKRHNFSKFSLHIFSGLPLSHFYERKRLVFMGVMTGWIVFRTEQHGGWRIQCNAGSKF